MHLVIWIIFIFLGLSSFLGWLLVVHNVRKFTSFQNETFFKLKGDQRLALEAILFLYGFGSLAIVTLIFVFLYFRYGF